MLEQRRPQKLTKRVVDAAKPRTGRRIIWDSELAGFGLRVEPTGRKTFIARYRAGGGRSGTLRQATIGRYGTLTLEQARVLARKTLGAAASGNDPVSDRRKARQPGITVSQVCDWYLEQAEAGRILGRKGRPMKASTIAMDRSRIETHVKPLIGRKPIRGLTTHDIEEMQADIAAGKTAKPRRALKQGGNQKQPRGGIATGGDGVAARSLGMIRTILEHARRKRLISENPAKGARRFSDRKRQRRLTLDQVRLLGKAMREAAAEGENSTGLAAIRFIALSGFRRHEALYSELTIAGLLGHASGSVTAGYVHLDAALVSAADRMSAVIAAALDGKPDAQVVSIGKKSRGSGVPLH
jgi:hypothetical protein